MGSTTISTMNFVEVKIDRINAIKNLPTGGTKDASKVIAGLKGMK